MWKHYGDKGEKPSNTLRRNFLRAGAVAGGALLAAPYVRNAKAAETITWKAQTSWPGGIGLEIFKEWCNSIKEKTGGELEFKAFGAKDVVGDFQLFDAVKNGVLEAMNPSRYTGRGVCRLPLFFRLIPWGCAIRMSGTLSITALAGWKSLVPPLPI